MTTPSSRTPQPANVRANKGATESLSAALALGLLAATMLVGWYYSDIGFINPEHGLGYTLGIAGSVMMLIMLLYPLRKRVKLLRALGPVKVWFRAHMMLGIVGPTLIVIHTNFSLGSTNGRVAMFCMVVVAVSGLVGRYLYRQIHHGLYGQKATLRDLREESRAIRNHDMTAGGLFPEVAVRLGAFEDSIELPPTSFIGRATGPLLINVRSRRLSRELHSYVRDALDKHEQTSPVVAAQRRRLLKVANRYVRQRLAVSRRIAMFRLYDQLFSLWHVLHIPLFILLVISAFIHVYAVHAY